MPVSVVAVRLSEQAGGTRIEMRSTYESRKNLEKIVEMGALEGVREAVGQIDALLAGSGPFRR
jgi:hypothetical protein